MPKKLERKLGLFPLTNIVLANIIGAGIFTTTGYLMDFLKNPLLMLSLWVIGGIIAFCGALAFGELGAAYPEAGGEYTFISKLFNPMLGFLSGWLSLIVGFSAPIAASAIGFSKYFLRAFPEVQEWLSISGSLNNEFIGRLLSILVIILFSGIHSLGLSLGTKVQNALTLLKILLVVGLIVLGFGLGEGNFESLQSSRDFSYDFSGWKSIGLSVMFIMFAYSGWNSATYIGSEAKNPGKTIPWSLLISTGLVMLMYVGVNLFFVYAIPAHKMLGEPEIGALAANYAFGKTTERVISLLIAFALFSSLSAFIILGPRVYYQMAKNKQFFTSMGHIHPKAKVPVNAILLQGGIAIILVLSGTFEQILTYMGFALGIFPIVAVAGVFKLRKQNKSVLKLPGFPIVHLFFIGTGVLILLLAFFERPMESGVAILTALSGIPVYYWFRKKNQ